MYEPVYTILPMLWRSSPFSNGALVGVDIYTDVDQQADILAFSDRNLLSAYLNRKNEPRKNEQ